MVGHLLLYQPAILFVKELSRPGGSGWVGTLYQDRLNLGTVRVTENACGVWACTTWPRSCILGNEPVRTATWGQRIIQPGVEDDMHLHMQFDDGAEHIHNSWLWPEQTETTHRDRLRAMVVYDENDGTVQLHRRRVNADLTVRDDGIEVLFRIARSRFATSSSTSWTAFGIGRNRARAGESAIPVMRVLEHAAAQLSELFTRVDA